MSDTPRVDAEITKRLQNGAYSPKWVPSDFARQLERELNEAEQSLTLPPPPVVPLEDVKKLQELAKEAVSLALRGDDEWDSFQSERLKNLQLKLSTLTAKHKL